MVEKHHDGELCKRLAETLDLVRKEIGAIERYPDFCCDPVASWMLEQKILDMGLTISTHSDPSEFSVTLWRSTEHSPDETWEEIGANRLHATALAVDKVIDEPTGLFHSCFEFEADEVDK